MEMGTLLMKKGTNGKEIGSMGNYVALEYYFTLL